MDSTLQGRTILLAGGTSAAGGVVARTALERGGLVVVVGHDPAKLQAIERDLPGVMTEACDLADETAVQALAGRLHARIRRIDGILHLVGGWRGGGGLAAQSEEDYRFLERTLTALRHVTRSFDADLRASDAGRLAIVSSTALARPLAGGANYAAVKAACEAWTRAVAQGFAKGARDAGQPLAAASVVFRVTALDGLEQTLADAFTDLWTQDAAALNDTTVVLEK